MMMTGTKFDANWGVEWNKLIEKIGHVYIEPS